MNNGEPNQGIRAIRLLLDKYSDKIEIDVFDVRAKGELPGTEYDLYISSGGPGDPVGGGETAYADWRKLIDRLWKHNQDTANPAEKKYVFLICHSFQMACHHFNLASIKRRIVPGFGIYPCHKTKAGAQDRLLKGLDDPYFVVDIREYQIVQPKLKVFEKRGAKILSLEKMRSHVEYERAIMAVRFSEEFVGTQYHPEADPYGMSIHFAKPENKEKVLKAFSIRKYNSMMKHLEDPEKIMRTHEQVIPAFLDNALEKIDAKIKSQV